MATAAWATPAHGHLGAHTQPVPAAQAVALHRLAVTAWSILAKRVMMVRQALQHVPQAAPFPSLRQSADRQTLVYSLKGVLLETRDQVLVKAGKYAAIHLHQIPSVVLTKIIVASNKDFSANHPA
ncbi:MAG: hypothetical protein A3A82_01900 [Candidatus Pacebacteria bacterium RIFCSPLOWO2_01_FULL_47_12]|nr:MAG: hypothetical protein A3A82_01900 [Candidatus Pacebacteria bacterium RIFCSPLOWO2_01_FULL_47_12]